VHIATNDQPFRSGPLGGTQRIDVYTNLSSVELYLNGRSLGSKLVGADRKASWDVVFAPGVNKLSTLSKKSEGAASGDAATIFFRPVDLSSREIAISVGSNADFTDASGRIWIADQMYKKGSWGFVGSDAKSIYSAPPDPNILGTLSDPLFQTQVEGLSEYRLDFPDGAYSVELLFAERKFEEPGKRIFDVSINGKRVIERLDLAATAGLNHAFKRIVDVEVRDGLSITFRSVVGEPVLNGVRILRK
jgi:beta-galactosidase